MSPATLLEFARVNDAAAATTKKLQKYELLAGYFSGLQSDGDLRLAVRYAAGRAFAATDERVLSVGGALVNDVALSLLSLEPQAYHDLCVKSGEIGQALSMAWSDRRDPFCKPSLGALSPDHSHLLPERDALPFAPPSAPNPAVAGSLALCDLAKAFDALAATGAWDAKRAILLDLYARCDDGREAAYLTKVVLGDMRTGVQEGVLQYAISQAFGRELAQIQRCQLLVGDLGEVAVLARHDRCASAVFRLFHPVLPMLATAQETADDAEKAMSGRTFYAEDKLDGIRAQIHKSGEGPAVRVAVYTRDLARVDASFPDVVAAVGALPGEFLLDGEIVPWQDGVVLPFAHIQKRLGRKAPGPKALLDHPAVFVAFDVLYRDGQLLMDEPLQVRRAALHSLCTAQPRVQPRPGAPAHESESPVDAKTGEDKLRPYRDAIGHTSITTVSTAADISAAFDGARGRRNEGIVLKDPQSPYSPGRRGQAWLKLKTHLPTLDCVVTAAETGHGKRRNWLSDYTFAVWDPDPAEESARLVNVGKAYSGLTEAEIVQLTEMFTALTIQQFGRVRLVRPQVVLEIACDQIQKSTRHSSGYALRFPRIKRIRWDKRPEDADRLSRVAEIYESSPNFARPVAAAPAPPLPAPTLFDL